MKKTFLIILFLGVLVSFFILMSVVTFSYSNSNLEKITERGNVIVGALEKYKEANGDYPQTLNELVPIFLKEIPDSGVDPRVLPFEIFGQNTEVEVFHEGTEYEETLTVFGADNFYYQVNASTSEKYGEFDYELSTSADSFVTLFSRSRTSLIYRPNGYYPLRTFETPHRKIGNWALITKYRTYGSDNTVIGPGI